MEQRNGGGGCGCFLLILLAGFLLYSHFHKEEKKEAAQQAAIEGSAAPSTVDQVVADVTPNREFDEDAAREVAVSALSGSTYEGEVGSMDCSDDCSGHNAGWQHGMDGEDCSSGDSESFNEGCEAYLTAIQSRVDQAHEAFNEGDAAFEQH